MVGLLLLSFALGSLSHSGSGGSLLFQATWLLYLIDLGPVVLLGLLVALVVLVAWNWRDMSEGLGHQMAKKRAARKKRSRFSLIISLMIWSVAVVILMEKQGTIFNPQATNSTTRIVAEITGQGGSPLNPFLGSFLFPTVSSFVRNEWFGMAFLGLIVICGMVLVQSVRVYLRETQHLGLSELEARRIEGLQAAESAIRLVEDTTADARVRIIACYQHMIMSVSRLGVSVSPVQTARELERAIRSAFMLEGTATHDLTMLFEEARYSLHSLGEQDAQHARELLELIAEELKGSSNS